MKDADCWAFAPQEAVIVGTLAYPPLYSALSACCIGTNAVVFETGEYCDWLDFLKWLEKIRCYSQRRFCFIG